MLITFFYNFLEVLKFLFTVNCEWELNVSVKKKEKKNFSNMSSYVNIPKGCRWSENEGSSRGFCLIFWNNCCLTHKVVNCLPKAIHSPFYINKHPSDGLANASRYCMVYALLLILNERVQIWLMRFFLLFVNQFQN